jgi:peptide-methionine (S)-S-oxide reductase
MTQSVDHLETITLGGGCFWCLEAVYLEVDGVTAVESGYCNGSLPNPSYEAVCSGLSGHAEVVQVQFDAARITLEEILEIFFAVHDPTSLNRQGHDVGTQYRSGIYWHEPAQAAVAEAVRQQAAMAWDAPVVTEIAQRQLYSPAEPYHQRYYARNPYQGYCQHVVAPKLARFRETFARRLKRR